MSAHSEAGTTDWDAETRMSYDTVAGSYADQVRHALAEQPYLSSALALFADSVRRSGGSVADMGCGPGQITAHLNELGIDAFGLDLSPQMIDVARRDHPGLRFEVGSIAAPELPDASVGGLIAWQSLIHMPDEDVRVALEHFRRVLRPGGPVQLLFHAGNDSWVKTQGYGGHPMNVPVYRRQPHLVAGWLREAGFEVEAHMVLNPDSEFPQALLFARRAA